MKYTKKQLEQIIKANERQIAEAKKLLQRVIDCTPKSSNIHIEADNFLRDNEV